MDTFLLRKSGAGTIGARSKLKITVIQTGTGNPPVRLIASPQNIGTLRRRLGVVFCRERTGPQPINAYLIEHPEGLIVVDTGDTARKSERGYLPRFNPAFSHSIDIRVAPEDEIGPQLNAMGIRSRDVRLVVLTHLHHDHAGGLHHFPHNRILATAENLRVARRWGELVGALPRHWPVWLDPEPLEFSGPAVGSFDRSAPLTRDGSVFAVETPGHMTGRVSIVARSEDLTYVLAGDLTYRQHLLLDDQVDGMTENPAVSLASQRAMKQFAQNEPTVLLPAHDPEAAKRLTEGLTMYPRPPADGARQDLQTSGGIP
jgi:glyoxylase-like metal-dependent hydrolase (beta-lactamase superfamily II)